MALFGVVAMGIMAYLFYAALEQPLYTTRAMYAIGAFIAIMGVYIASGVKKELILTLPVVVLAWCFFSFSFTYGNALKEQDTFRNMQIDMVIADVNEITADGTSRKIQAVGQIDFAPAIKHMPEKEYHILRRLLKPSFETYVPWMAYRLREASGLPGLVFDPGLSLDNTNLPEIKNTALYIIYGDNENILVKFKGEEFNIWEN
jgi:energy-coupling factor transporter transmembrane protein EcfT